MGTQLNGREEINMPISRSTLKTFPDTSDPTPRNIVLYPHSRVHASLAHTDA